MAVKDARRLARDIARQYDGKVHERTRAGVTYIFPDMFCWFIAENDSWATVAEKARRLRERYGHKPRQFATLRNRPGKPRIDLDRLRASDHAQQRLALMREQGGVTFQEVLLCLRTPERVLWSDEHGSWLWVRDRLAVAVAAAGAAFVVDSGAGEHVARWSIRRPAIEPVEGEFCLTPTGRRAQVYKVVS